MSVVLTDEQVDTAVATRGLQWHRADGALVKVVKCAKFAGSLEYVNAVGELAEQAGHHPDIEISWDTVTLRLVTHSAGGITSADLALAGEVDALGATGGASGV